jgi:Domain of unknown function (DUF4156)
MSQTCKKISVAVSIAALVAGCSWVRLNDAGQRVRVAKDASQVAGCTEMAEMTTSVADKIAFVSREKAKVRDEVEALAREQAAEVGADTVLATSEVVDGAQNFKAYRCKQ